MLKKFKGRLKKTARRVLGDEDRPAQGQPASPPPRPRSISLTANPVPRSPTAPVAFDPILRPTSTPPTSPPANRSQGWECLSGFTKTLATCAGAFAPLRGVIEDLSTCINVYEDFLSARQDYATLRVDLEGLFSTLSCHFSGNSPPTITASINNLCMAIDAELEGICKKEERRNARRYLEAKQDPDKVMECYRRVHEHVRRLMLNADLSTWKIVDEQATEARLKSLAPSMSACYDSAEAAVVRRRECTPKTRTKVLADLSHWRHDQAQGNRSLYWMNGMAGTGKTTIANSLCAMLDRDHELGASFFCSRQLPECRNIKMILPTIAYQLARFSRPFLYSLSQSLERDPDIHSKALVKQFEGMIAGPLQEVADSLPADLVVVIDALDECDDPISVGVLLEMFAKHVSRLPVKIFVSSRPEPQIRQKMGNTSNQLILHELEESIVKEDIETYLRVELERMSLTDEQVARLVERSGVLFIYAATVIRYVGEDDFSLNPKKRLEGVLGVSVSGRSNKNQEIDELYAMVLASALDSPKLEIADKETMHLVLHTIICAQEPLTVDAIASLLELDDVDQVHAALRPLWSVLRISRANGLVSTLHASFPDYMLDPARSKQYWCNHEQHHGIMGELCLHRISKNQTQFNICGLESSYQFDDQVPDLEARVARAIPSELLYACRYWMAHLERAVRVAKHAQIVKDFLSVRLLLWMEVLNLTKLIGSGILVLEKALSWCTGPEHPQELRDLIHDAWRFATAFSTSPACRSTPHIYVSTLASWPPTNPIAVSYAQRTRGLVKLEGTGMARRQLAQLSVYPMNRGVESVAFSPDGAFLACGSGNAVSVWDVRNHRIVLGPLEKHDAGVESVTFSSDGASIVSGSSDGTICIWNAHTGELMQDPLQNGEWVSSVAISPNGMRIVSGASDHTVSIWDVPTGNRLLGPLEGHSDWVYSVAFSPNGKSIASGAMDSTVRVWDAESGQTQLGPFEPDANDVFSVAFSPDGSLLVLGTRDSVCVWDLRAGQLTLGPLRGHSGPVFSAVFSPDGGRIVSAGDETIRVWDSATGELALGPLEGHLSSIQSVAFSPDGTRIASAGYDPNIYIWDPQARGGARESKADSNPLIGVSFDGEHVVSVLGDMTMCRWKSEGDFRSLKLLGGPEEANTKVAFSPDFRRLATVGDGKIFIWDAQSGEFAREPFEALPWQVWSLVFSPDGTRIASGYYDGSICIWDVESGEWTLCELYSEDEEDNGHVRNLVFSPDGTNIASSLMRGPVRFYDTQTGQRVLSLLEAHTTHVASIAFSPDGELIAYGSYDRSLHLRDTRNGQLKFEPLTDLTGFIQSLTFSPDGTRLASGSRDKTIIVRDVQTGDIILGPLRGHTGWVESVIFSPDGTRIVSGSEDQVLRVWRVQDANSLAATDSISTTDHPGALVPSTYPRLARTTSPLWMLDEDGWAVDTDGHLLVWVPLDLRQYLLVPQNDMLLSHHGSVRLNFEGAKIGESWTECCLHA